MTTSTTNRLLLASAKCVGALQGILQHSDLSAESRAIAEQCVAEYEAAIELRRKDLRSKLRATSARTATTEAAP